MKKLSDVARYFFIILVGILATTNVFGETQMTALEKKLYEAARKEGKVQYWDSMNLKEVAQYIAVFNKRYPKIDVSYWEGNSSAVDVKYFAEVLAGRNAVDLMQVEWYDKYKKEGRLVNLRDIIEDTRYPLELCSKDLDTVAIEHTLRGSAYNTKLVAPNDVPRTWEDLLNPKWKGKIAIESSMSVFITLTANWGEEKMVDYLKKLREQNPIFVNGATQTTTLLGAGEFPLAVNILLHRTLIMQTKGSPVAQVPISPIVDKFSPVVIPRNGPNPNAAKLYLRWLMTPEGMALADKVRFKGNPLPGAGTAQAKAVEQLGIKVLVVPGWEVDLNKYQTLYSQVLGFTADKAK